MAASANIKRDDADDDGFAEPKAGFAKVWPNTLLVKDPPKNPNYFKIKVESRICYPKIKSLTPASVLDERTICAVLPSTMAQ